MQKKTTDQNAKIIWDYMHLHQPLKKADAIFVLCSHDTRVAVRGAELFLAGYGEWLIFSGGFGTITGQRFKKPEARVFADIAIKLGVPKDKIIIEDKSTNTGENIRFTYELLKTQELNVTSFVLVQKPYMERRTYATFKKQWPDDQVIISATSPKIPYEEYFTKDVRKEDVLNIMVGDLQRIREYPKFGFQIEQDIPKNVRQAYKHMVTAGYTKHLIVHNMRPFQLGRRIKKYRWPLVGLAVLGAALLWGPWTYALISTATARYDSASVKPQAVPVRRVAIVFGARVNGDDPTPYLRYRVEAAAALYKAGRVQKLLMTGDNSFKNYDEPAVMRATAISLGVKASDITVDDAGFSTFDSCYRAKHIFMVDSAVLVSQNYHLPRAIMACRGVGISSIGYGATATHPFLVAEYTAREWLSTDKIVWQLATGAKSKFGGVAEPIR